MRPWFNGRRTRVALAVAATALVTVAVYVYQPLEPHYRGRTAAWWAEELERGRYRMPSPAAPQPGDL